jgi:hypothetical protein
VDARVLLGLARAVAAWALPISAAAATTPLPYLALLPLASGGLLLISIALILPAASTPLAVLLGHLLLLLVASLRRCVVSLRLRLISLLN